MTIVFGVAIMVVSIALIVTVLMQDSETGGLSALGGGSADTFFGKNKSKGLDAKLALITKILAGLFVVLCIAMMFFK